MKRKVLDGARKSDIEYYMEAGSIYYGQLQAQEAQKMQAQQQAYEAKLKAESDKIALEAAKAEKIKREAAAKAASKKKAAAPTKNRSGKQDVVDYLDTDAMTDEEFSAFMDKQLK
jgi:membrane protein involved in colicin uptake